jgi:hypothetical protein
VNSDEIARIIQSTAFRFSNEFTLQDGLEALFEAKGVPFAREVVLSPRDRIDFLSGNIGIEVKVASSIEQVRRQLWRYAQREQIAGLILVTTRSMHKALQGEILGKPVVVAHLLASIF